MCIKETLSKQLTERWDASDEYRAGWRQSFVYSALGYNRYELYAFDGRLVFIADRPAAATSSRSASRRPLSRTRVTASCTPLTRRVSCAVAAAI
jgi:hypothetical protein